MATHGALSFATKKVTFPHGSRFADMSVKKNKKPSFALQTHTRCTMDTSGWRTIKRNAPNAPKRAPSIVKRQCKEKAAMDNDEVEPAVTTTNVEPTDPVADGASSPVSDENTEVAAILETEEVKPACTTASLLADETLTSSESGEPTEPEGDPSDDWLHEIMKPSRGRCIAILVNEDGIEEQCSEDTNGHTQLCHFCARDSIYRFWRA